MNVNVTLVVGLPSAPELEAMKNKQKKAKDARKKAKAKTTSKLA